MSNLPDTRQFRKGVTSYYPTDEEIKSQQDESKEMQIWYNTKILCKNIYIGLMNPMHDGKIALNVREHYNKLGYKLIRVWYNVNDNSVRIEGEGSRGKDGVLMLPLHNISSMGVDVLD